MSENNKIKKERKKYAFDSYLGYHRSWWNYYHNYKNVIDEIFISISNRNIPIDTISLPLMFLIRHSLELGLKANILSFEKLNKEIKKLDLQGRKSHQLKYLSNKFIDHLHCSKSKYVIKPEILTQIDNFIEEFNPLIEKIHNLDKASVSFRYPTDRKENNNFNWDVRENIEEIKNSFEKIQPFLLFTEAVLIEEGIIELANTTLT